ncbi:MAG: hypothetical protein HZB54_05885 [Deltaproteobacteria bacterium]|nr:hypothetical protein [Deltaproteobacteria bacterium]
MKRDIKLYLHDIRESILAIEDYIGALTEDDFYKSRDLKQKIFLMMENKEP